MSPLLVAPLAGAAGGAEHRRVRRGVARLGRLLTAHRASAQVNVLLEKSGKDDKLVDALKKALEQARGEAGRRPAAPSALPRGIPQRPLRLGRARDRRS